LLNKADKADLKLITNSFSKTKLYEAAWLEYERMYESRHTQQFLDDAKENERNAIFIPLVYSTINIADAVFTSAFFSSGNPIELIKVGSKDEKKKSELKRIVDYFYYKAKPYNELSKAFLSASIFGTGSVKLNWDSSSKLPDTTMIPATEVGFDIDAISSKDNQYTVYKFMQSLQEINQKIKDKFYKVKRSEKEPLLRGLEDNQYKRKLVKEIYKKEGLEWKVKTFIGDILVRKATFKRNPIKSGYLLHLLPYIDKSKRNDQIAAIGDSLVRVIKPLSEELNVKRNQRMDLIEKHINPTIWLPTGAGLDPEDETKNGGIKNVETTSGIMFEPISGASEFTQDVAMLKSDVEDASSINGIMRGNTSASDRRSSSALANIGANSSIRLESMIKLISETLFEDWARDFVRLCYINADDDLILEILEQEEHSLGIKGTRVELEIDININFGININKQAKISDLIAVLEMMSKDENANLEDIKRELVKLILGENADVEKIFGVSGKSRDGDSTGTDGRGDESVSETTSSDRGATRTEQNSLQDERVKSPKNLHQIRNNEI
jgi:hypothetical protein